MPHFEYDKDYPFAAFITNLGKYNEGELVGEWVRFPTTAEDMKKVFERIGIGQKDDFGNPYEEWFISDYDYCLADPVTVEGTIEAKTLARIIESFLDTLSEENRVIFMRRYWFSDSYADIAKHTGMTEKNVSVRLTRTRKQLREYLIEKEVLV